MPAKVSSLPEPAPDGVALDEIQRLLSSPGSLDCPPLDQITALVQRTGRRCVPVRGIEACRSETRGGRPCGRVYSDGTSVEVSQDPDGPGLHVRIRTLTRPDSDALRIMIDDQVLAWPPRHVTAWSRITGRLRNGGRSR